MTLVEAAVDGLDALVAAQRAGVGRIELCADLDVGGTTPAPELIVAAIETARIPVFAMIRPRAGDFVYDAAEMDGMRREMEGAGRLGVHGFVTGALARDSTIDVTHLRSLVTAANGAPVTFHRAFDSTPDLVESLERLVEAGITRVLTSGGAARAMEGIDSLTRLVQMARGRITVIAAGSIRGHNVREIISRTGVSEVHARVRDYHGARELVDASTALAR